jgi:hypothetical protein
MRRSSVIIALLAVAPLAGLVATVLLRHRGAGMATHLSGGNRVLRERIDTEVAALKGETLEQATWNVLTNSQQYYGYISPELNPRINVEQMLAARRAVKVIQSVEGLPAGQRENVCKSTFALAFNVHTNTISIAMQAREDPTAPRNHQSLLATQIGICTAMFITADLGLRDELSKQFQQLERYRDEVIKQRISARPDAHPPLAAHVVLLYSMPDLRFQLCVLRLAAERGAHGPIMLTLVDEEIRTNNVHATARDVPVVAWNAETTWFEEIKPGRPLGTRMDGSKGVKRYRVFDLPRNADEEDVRGLIRKLRQLVAAQ